MEFTQPIPERQPIIMAEKDEAQLHEWADLNAPDWELEPIADNRWMEPSRRGGVK
jgi:hypothetical protein